MFFVRDPVDDDVADAVIARLRGVDGAGWFDDPDGEPRTTGGYVRCADPAEGEALLDAARAVSRDHEVTVEVQWREASIAHISGGLWRDV